MNRDPVDGERLPVSVTSPVVTGLSRPVAATIGVLAAWLALGVGHLAAGLFAAGSSPYLAVGDAVVRLSPQALTEFAKTTFGTWDKPVLLVGMFVVITLVAAAGGLASRWRRQPGMVVIGAMGVLGGGRGDLRAGVHAGRPARAARRRRRRGRGVRAVARPRAAGEWTGPTRPGAPCCWRVARPSGWARWRRRAAGCCSPAACGAARADVTALLGRAKYVERATPAPAGAAFPQLGTPTFLTANSEFYRIDTALRVPTLSAVGLEPPRARHGRARAHAALRGPGRAARSSSAPSR